MEELQELHLLCQQGRLYEVEEWIQQGFPLQCPFEAARSSRHKSALAIALETGQHSLTLLLLRSGYRPNDERISPFNIALKKRRKDLIDLLFKYDADPHRVDLYDLFDSYDTKLFERFRSAGVDLTKDHIMAEHLADHTSNKPLFGFAKRCRETCPAIQTELDMALGGHVHENNEKGVMLCLWAGADPYASVPDLRYGRNDDSAELWGTSIEEAVHSGNLHALKLFKPDPARIDFDELYGMSRNRAHVQFLAEIKPPGNITQIVKNLSHYAGLTWFIEYDWAGTTEAVLSCGIQWEPAEPKVLADIRRNLLKAKDWELGCIVKALQTPEVCAPENFHELTRTPSMQKRLLDQGLVKPYVKPPSERELWSREVKNMLARFDREKLYEEVWQQPVTEVAKMYKVSDVYLGRICRTLRIPVPPRGYWARVRSGQKVKRPRLLKLRY